MGRRAVAKLDAAGGISKRREVWPAGGGRGKIRRAAAQGCAAALAGRAGFSLPLSLVSPQQGSILFETGKAGGDEAVGAINNIIFRLLATTPPGKLSFTIFDPVGLGQNFAALMHLADYEEGSINSRIWTQTAQFEEKLAELNEHMEKIIQMYLRNEYATIAEYNAQAGSVAEKYHFLVIASFPVNFSDTAARRLRNIAANGARCGVFTLIQWDQRNALPQDFVPDELRKNSVCLVRTDNGFALADWRSSGVRLLLDPPPPAEFATEFLHRVGAGSKDANRVEVPFEAVAPAAADIWKEETTECCACRSAVPARRNCNISKSAAARASTRSSRAKPVPANPLCSTSSSPISRCGAARSRWNFISWISRRASSSNATPAADCRTRASWPSRATANLA